jgi:hypothetical protein
MIKPAKQMTKPVVEMTDAPMPDPTPKVEQAPVEQAPVEEVKGDNDRVTFKVHPSHPAFEQFETTPQPPKVEVKTTAPRIVPVAANTLVEMEAGRRSIERYK